jgi:HK97 family phage portal protein
MSFWRRGEERTLAQPTLQPLFTYFPIGTITPTTAPLNPDVYACMRVLADAAASCPLIVYRRRADGERSRASGRTAELLRAPSEGTTQAAFVSTVMSHLLLQGNSFLGKYRNADGRVEQLIPIDPSSVSVERRKGKIVFTVSSEGRTREHGLDDLVHIRALSTDGLIGLSPIRAMRTALELNEATRTASTALFQNNARPSGILSMDHRVTADQAQIVKGQWNTGHLGENAGGIAVVSGEIHFTPVAMSADDAQFIEARRLTATEIARAFRIPAWMISAGDASSQTYSNVESQMLSFVMLSLRPWLTVIEQALAADRDLFSASLFPEFLIDGLLRADSKTRAEIYTAALDPVTGWLRRDEVRRLENLEPETAADLATLVASAQTTNGVAA